MQTGSTKPMSAHPPDEVYASTTGVLRNASLADQGAAFLSGGGRSFDAGIEFKW